jgi:hypothetical protein
VDFIYKEGEKKRNDKGWREAEGGGSERERQTEREREMRERIYRMRGKPILQPVCSQWQNRAEPRLIKYKNHWENFVLIFE